jgi:hypothetical protein
MQQHHGGRGPCAGRLPQIALQRLRTGNRALEFNDPRGRLRPGRGACARNAGKKRSPKCRGFGGRPDAHQGFMKASHSWRKRVGRISEASSLEDPSGLFNASLEGNVRRAIDIRKDDEINEAAFKSLIRAAAALNRSKAR